MTWSPSRRIGWLYGNGVALDRDAEPNDILAALLASPSVASKRWAFEQYDSIVQSRTVRRPESADAAVLRLEETGRGDRGGDRRQRASRRVRSLPRDDRGGARVRPEPRLRRSRAARADELPQLRQPREAARRLAARPLGAGARRRMSRRSDVPVVGGNVSLYNETEEGPIYPTPVVGMVGELPDPGRAAGDRAAPRATRSPWSGPSPRRSPGRSSPSCAATSTSDSRAPRSSAVREAIELVRDSVRAGVVVAAHDVSDGGLACALAECAHRRRSRGERRPRRAGGAPRRLGRGLPVRRGRRRDLRRRPSGRAGGARRHRAKAGRRRDARSGEPAGIGSRSRPPRPRSRCRSMRPSARGARSQPA